MAGTKKSSEAVSGKRRAHYSAGYARQAKQVRARAYADPTTPCGRCGRTLADHPPGATWDAGHVTDGQVGGPLRPEASTCNRSAGAAYGNRLRQGLRPTRDW